MSEPCDTSHVRCYICGREPEIGEEIIVTALRADDSRNALTEIEVSPGRSGLLRHASCEGMLEGARLSVDAERRVRRRLKGVVGR